MLQMSTGILCPGRLRLTETGSRSLKRKVQFVAAPCNIAAKHAIVSASGHISFGVVILAAGASRRMGRPKLLLPWGGSSMLEHAIRQWGGLQASQIGVVSAAGPGPVQDELDRIHFPGADRIANVDPDRGMFSSICCAAAWAGWNAEVRHWVISLGDQPHVRGETLQALIDFATANPDKICQPLRNGRRRHPVLLTEAAFRALKDCSCSDFKQFLESRVSELAGFESDDAGLDFDIDTPADYERARQFHVA